MWCDVTANEVVQNRQGNGLKAMSQSLSNVRTKCILSIILGCIPKQGILVLDGPYFASLDSWVISRFLDQWLVPRSMLGIPIMHCSSMDHLVFEERMRASLDAFPTLDLPFVHLFSEKNSSIRPTRNSSLLPVLSATSPPKSSKTLATKTPSTSGSWVWSFPHAYTNKTQAHVSLSAYSLSLTFSPAAMPHFHVDTHDCCEATTFYTILNLALWTLDLFSLAF